MEIRSERSQIALILVVVTTLWAGYVGLAYDPVAGVYSPFNPDTYATLTIARTFAHGHPWRLNPGDPPCTMLSDLLSPMYFSLGYWLGFRDTSSFVLWAYLATLPLAVVAALSLWRFFSRFTAPVAFPATLSCLIFPGIFVNLFTTNFGLLFASFWAAMASLHSFPRFVVLAVLAGLFRPEGILIYLFLCMIFLSVNGRRCWWRLLPGVLPLMIPHLIYLRATGGFMPQGVVPQNIIHYHGIVQSLHMAAAAASDQLKGAVLGLFPGGLKIGAEGSSWIGALPPLVFVLGAFGMYATQRRWLLPVLGSLLLFVAADSFTSFSGIHYNRHLHVLTPLVFGFALLSLKRMTAGRGPWFVACMGVGGVLLCLQLVSTLGVCRSMVRVMATDKTIADYIVSSCPPCRAFDMSTRIQYWADDRIRWHTLTPSVDPYLGRYVRHFHALTETAEHLQRFAPDPAVFVGGRSDDILQEWVLSLKRQDLAIFTSMYANARQVSLLDLSALVDTPPYPDPVDELDVGDAVSEHTHGYRYASSLPTAVGGFLHEGEGYRDGGRPSVSQEQFDVFVPEGGVLIARYRGDYSGYRLRFPHRPVSLSIRESPLTVVAGGDTVFCGTVTFSEGFSHIEFPLTRAGMQRISVTGVFHSFHYWTYGSRAPQ